MYFVCWLVNKQTRIGTGRGMNLRIMHHSSVCANAVEKFSGP
jgi:hypothetical protein